MALTDKLVAIANAIRGKTGKTEKLTLPQMVDEINNEWKIKCYVNQLYIQDINDDSDWKYVHKNIGGRTNDGILLSYTPENDIMLTAASNDGGRENIVWNISSAPAGVSIYTKSDWKQFEPTGNSGAYQSCVITGINQNCSIAADCGTTGGSTDIFTINLFITYL